MISIIVPLYNVEEYLSRCVDSIIAQTYRDIQIILVDDGSTDGSGRICDEYALKDSRIMVIHKKNGGQSSARNMGIEAATGDYIGFVDSDDWISEIMYERLYETAVELNADIVECRYVKTSGESIVSPRSEAVVYNPEGAIRELIAERKLFQTIVNKLYTRKTAVSERFTEGNICEDEVWTYRVFGNANKIAFIDEIHYYYYNRSGSTMTSEYSIRRLFAVEALYGRLEYVTERFPALEAAARRSYVGECFYAYQRITGKKEIDPDKKYRKMLIKRVRAENGKPTVKNRKLTHKIWFVMFKTFPSLTCEIRNLLKVGL